MNTIVDEIFVISLEKDSKRFQIFDQLMNRFNWKYTKFTAIDGSKLSAKNYYFNKFIKASATLTRGEMGCLASHATLWEKVATDPSLNRILIFEDDARTFSNAEYITTVVNDFYQYLQTNNLPEPDMLYLGKCCDLCMHYEKIYGDFYKSLRPLCGHAYIITKKAAKVLMDMAPYDRAADLIIPAAINKKLISPVVIHPSIFYQDIFDVEPGQKVTSSKTNLRSVSRALYNVTECYTGINPTSSSWTVAIFVVIAIFIFAILLLFFFLY